MSFILDFERAVDYIDENLSDEIDFERIAKITNCSAYRSRQTNYRKIQWKQV